MFFTPKMCIYLHEGLLLYKLVKDLCVQKRDIYSTLINSFEEFRYVCFKYIIKILMSTNIVYVGTSDTNLGTWILCVVILTPGMFAQPAHRLVIYHTFFVAVFKYVTLFQPMFVHF